MTVIDWDSAIEQCGDDEEFLRELLLDLKGELHLQLHKIHDEIERNILDHESRSKIERAAHVIKGTSANLMCHELKEASTALERHAKKCLKPGLVDLYFNFQKAQQNFHQLLAEKSIF